MRLQRTVVVLALLTLPASPLRAQPAGGYVFGAGGVASLSDDEGRLGSGPLLAVGAGVSLMPHLGVEVAGTWARHERSGSLSWVGKPLTLTVRALYRSGGRETPVRFVAGGGFGYFRYPGTFSQTVFDGPPGPGSGPGAPRRVSSEWLLSGIALELVAGLEIAVGRHVFVRPEAGLAAASPDRVLPAPEPPYSMPRGAIAAGVRF